MIRTLLFDVAQRVLNPEVRRKVEGGLVTTALVLFVVTPILFAARLVSSLGTRWLMRPRLSVWQ